MSCCFKFVKTHSSKYYEFFKNIFKFYIFYFILSAFIESFHKFIGKGEVQEQGKRYILYMYASVSLWVIFCFIFLVCFAFTNESLSRGLSTKPEGS